MKKFKALSLIGLLVLAGSANAGTLGQLFHVALASLATQEAPKVRLLGGHFKAKLAEPALITPPLPFGFQIESPNSSHSPAVGNSVGFKPLGQVPPATIEERPARLLPDAGANHGGVAVDPVTSTFIGTRTIFESALPLMESLLMIPRGGKPELPSGSRPLITPLPAIEMKGLKAIGEGNASTPSFRDGEARVPAVGESITQGASPIKVLEPKLAAVQDKKVTIVAANVDLNRVLSILSDQTKANLVLLSATDAKLTVRLQDVKFIDAIKHICTLAGLSYITASGAYILGPEDKLKAGYPEQWKAQHPETTEAAPTTTEIKTAPVDPPQEPIIARTISTSYVDAQSMADSIKALLGENSIQVAPGPSQLSPSIVDRDTQQATGVAQGIIQNDGRPVSRTIILRGPKKLVEDAMQIVKDLDQPRPQVAISVTIHDITDTALKELGVTWELGGFTINETPSNNGGLNLGRVTRTGTNFTAALKGLEQTDKAKLLASPSVRVMDRERAFVLIGSRLKFPVVTSFSSNGNPIITTQEEKVGVYLQVAPQIAADRSIMLTLYPQVSTVVSFLQIGGSSFPQIDSREAQTTLRIMSGETIVIGGLYKDEELSKITQVPLLAQIPLIGELFKNRRKTKTASQVIITLAIELVEPE